MKWKAWDKENNKWFEPTYRAYGGHVEELLMSPSGELSMRTLNHQHENVITHQSMFPNRFQVVYSTGLTDRNGKEICEGDIDGSDEPMYVAFEDGSFGLKFRGKPNYFDNCINWDMCEVVGNIYEHPHLLELGLPEAIESTE